MVLWRQGPKGSEGRGWTVVGALIRYKKGQQREARIREENETVRERVKGLYEGMVRAMKRVLMEEVAMRAIREYHGLQEGMWGVEKKAEIERVEEQETSLAQQIRRALGQAHEAQQKGDSALATQHHEEASRLREEMEQQGRERDEGQQARSAAVDARDTSSTREATGTESGAGASGRVAQGRGEQQVGVSEHGMEATRESKEESAREQKTWGKGETQEGGEADVYEARSEEMGGTQEEARFAREEGARPSSMGSEEPTQRAGEATGSARERGERDDGADSEEGGETGAVGTSGGDEEGTTLHTVLTLAPWVQAS